MAKIAQGKIMLEWGDGKRREIATIDLDTEAKGMGNTVTVRTCVRWFVFGWEFVKMGLRIMRRGWHGEETEIAE